MSQCDHEMIKVNGCWLHTCKCGEKQEVWVPKDLGKLLKTLWINKYGKSVFGLTSNHL